VGGKAKAFKVLRGGGPVRSVRGMGREKIRPKKNQGSVKGNDSKFSGTKGKEGRLGGRDQPKWGLIRRTDLIRKGNRWGKGCIDRVVNKKRHQGENVGGQGKKGGEGVRSRERGGKLILKRPGGKKRKKS